MVNEISYVVVFALFFTQGERLCEIVHFIPRPLKNQLRI